MLNLMLRRRRHRWPILFLCTFFLISLFVHKQIVFLLNLGSSHRQNSNCLYVYMNICEGANGVYINIMQN